MGGWGLEGLGMSAAAAAGSGGMPGGLSAKQQKLFELRMRMVRVPLPRCALVVSRWGDADCSAWQNEGRKVNHMEVAAEKRRATDPDGERKRQRELSEMRVEKRKREKEEAGAGGKEEIEEGEEEAPNRMLSMSLEQAEALRKKQDKKEKGKAAFGWDVFNQDTLYKAHKKKVAKLKPDLEAYEAAKAEAGEDFYRDANSLAYGGAGFQPTEEKVEGMVQHLLDAAEARNKFSRRRPEVCWSSCVCAQNANEPVAWCWRILTGYPRARIRSSRPTSTTSTTATSTSTKRSTAPSASTPKSSAKTSSAALPSDGAAAQCLRAMWPAPGGRSAVSGPGRTAFWPTACRSYRPRRPSCKARRCCHPRRPSYR